MSRIKLWLVVTFCLFLWSQANAQPASAAKAKAAFIYDSLQFIQWPSETLPKPESPIVVGIVADESFGYLLDEIVRDKKVNGHPIAIERLLDLNRVQTCHVVFIGRSQPDRIAPVLEKMGNRGIFAISDTDGFATSGGTLELFTENGKLRFKINVGAAKRARLQVSSKLLRLAKVVTTKRT